MIKTCVLIINLGNLRFDKATSYIPSGTQEFKNRDRVDKVR